MYTKGFFNKKEQYNNVHSFYMEVILFMERSGLVYCSILCAIYDAVLKWILIHIDRIEKYCISSPAIEFVESNRKHVIWGGEEGEAGITVG